MNHISEKVLVVLGTRPEAIKLAGVIRALGEDAAVIHTGQHYDENMWGRVLNDLAGVSVTDHIAIGGRTRGEQVGLATQELTRYLVQHPARAVVVQGDTNSTLAGALAANMLGIPVIHVEAGLRSHDRTMPEEINRILVDQVAELCCAPVEANAEQLRREGVSEDRIAVTGNTLSDALSTLQIDEVERTHLMARYGVEGDDYVLSTIHRAGTVDDREKLTGLLKGLAAVAERTTVLLPLHPHTRKNIATWGLEEELGRITVIEPLPPKEFVTLEAHAGLIISDSGGVQEEACLFRRPLLVVRDSTERPELLDGWCRLLGDEDPTIAMVQAWDVSAGWREQLARRDFPYCTDEVSAGIVGQINSRWPAAHHGHEHDA
ncbi:non-hydrolyzing UDP-N-acetylglucosamine 2-epimerase [Luteococcus japonicus]|uniref:UDP-N-acetylglucosamine 2-epimerase n=1 Tax=Luteococcus japonicus LSP_Lj1 TaxID=1255658 RepID=A0A1R4J634_9ACTN|nr:UDP-N-acetylglucosamine 2-epimerase (non-hydrolyzing) [Luteococcus japonicus]SJN27560.1 UDP-N-acetylglucosamine 2-epimerase [Luteococcus japonicus LSP_Lj1]